MRFDIELDGRQYHAITRATLTTDLNDYTTRLTLTEGPGNFADQVHHLDGDTAHLQALLQQCQNAGIPTGQTSTD